MPEKWAGRSLADIEEPGRIALVGVTRAGVPRLDARQLVGQEGDQLHVAVMQDALAELEHAASATLGGRTGALGRVGP